MLALWTDDGAVTFVVDRGSQRLMRDHRVGRVTREPSDLTSHRP
jgi:hypothetical protein